MGMHESRFLRDVEPGSLVVMAGVVKRKSNGTVSVVFPSGPGVTTWHMTNGIEVQVIDGQAMVLQALHQEQAKGKDSEEES